MNKYFLAPFKEDASLQQRHENMREQERRDASLDEALGFTFPASDPVALNFSYCISGPEAGATSHKP